MEKNWKGDGEDKKRREYKRKVEGDMEKKQERRKCRGIREEGMQKDRRGGHKEEIGGKKMEMNSRGEYGEEWERRRWRREEEGMEIIEEEIKKE